MLGPQRVEDNPGAVPLNDRGFCLPVSVTPILPPRLPTTIPLEYGVPGMDNRGQQHQQQHQRRNSHPNNRQNQGGYPQMNGGYPMEMPQMPPPMFQGLLGPNPNGFPQSYPNPLNTLAGRPPLPPQAMYSMGGMGYPNDLNMRMLSTVPNLTAVSMDPYESLLMATDRLSLTTQDSQSFMSSNNGGNSSSDTVSPSNHESVSNRSSRSVSGISSGNAAGTPTGAQSQQHQQQLQQQQQLMNSMSTYAPYPTMNPQAMNMNFMNMMPTAAMFGPTPTGPMDNKGGYYFN
jgi:hypothetical protein